jgi:non-specific serine/threonine protein kinase/serine/threonine-protein kinase
MSETSQPQTCGKCGGVLSGYAPDGLCAACLMESALEERDATSVEPAQPPPLLAFNDYQVLEEIARGGMGVVYRARQTSLNRTVALKMILGGQLANAAEFKRFRAEAETAAQLQHPNIVAIHEIGEHAGQPFFSMDLVEGRNLAQLVRDESLPSRKAAAYLRTIAEAVQYAHSHGVLHRDLKPSNILIDENDQPRITDFGLAKRLNDPQLATGDPQLTQTGQVLGSPSFIPPEQAAGQKGAIGPASDVYSLGAILYHCLTARPPFVAETLAATLRMVAENEALSPRLLNLSVPLDLETICLKCLEKNPSRRYATAQDLADELNRFLHDEPIHARPVSVVMKVHRWCVRNKALAVSGTVIMALLLVVAIGSPIALLRINRERLRAQTEAAKSEQRAKYLKDMVNGVVPWVALGRDTTLLRDILDKTAIRVGNDSAADPEVGADLRNTLGEAYSALGASDQAETMLRSALETRSRIFGKDHVQVAESLHALSSLFFYSGDYKKQVEAEAMAREAVAIRKKWFGPQSPEFSDSLSLLASALMHLGRLDESETTQRDALAVRRQLAKQETGDVAESLTELGRVLAKEGKEAEAEEVHREAVAINKVVFGVNHPQTARAISMLAALLQDQDRLAEAEILFREALTIRTNVMTADHPGVAVSLNALASVLAAEGKIGEAETLFRNAIELRKSVAAKTDSFEDPYAAALGGLAKMMRGQGKRAEARFRGTRCRGDKSKRRQRIGYLGRRLRRSWRLRKGS